MTDKEPLEAIEENQQEESGVDKEKRTIRQLIMIPVMVVLAIVVLTTLFGEKKIREKIKPVRVGDVAPDFTYPDMDGNQITLSSLRGKVVFINIWATWCPTCVDEMPSMEKLYQQFKGRGLEILAISIDVLGEQVVRPFMEKYNLTFPALLDEQGTIKKLYPTTGVPESFVVDQEGKIAFIAIGPRDWTRPEIVGIFENLLKEG